MCFVTYPGYSGQYRCEGNVVWTSFTNDGEECVRKTSIFTASIDNCRWAVKVTPADPEQREYDFREAVYDGEKIYTLDCFKSLIRNGQALKKGEGNIATSTVSRRPVPHLLEGHEIGPVWLMIASTCYLQGISGELIEPVGLGANGMRDYFPMDQKRVTGFITPHEKGTIPKVEEQTKDETL